MDVMAVSLPDDVILEILVRLNDVVALFRCAMACKGWRRLVADTPFLHRCWPEEAIAGFFTTDQRDGQDLRRPCFVPTPRSAMPRGCRALSAFVNTAASQILDGAKPLVARHGLLLLRLAPHGDFVNLDPTAIQLGVCNLLTGDCHVLPPLKCADRIDQCSGYAILSGADLCFTAPSSASPSSFKVAIIDTAELGYNLHMFSSGQSTWAMPTKCFSGPNTGHYIPISYGAAVVSHGTAYWLFYNLISSFLYTLDMDGETGQVKVTTIPFRIDYTTIHETKFHPFLTFAIDGTLSLIYFQKNGPGLAIGKIVDAAAEYLCTLSIELEEPGKPLNQGISNIYMLQEKYGAMVVKGISGRVYVADLETKTLEELVDWPRYHASSVEVVPLQMDWSAFFLSRLATR